jgi:hypothetical protein
MACSLLCGLFALLGCAGAGIGPTYVPPTPAPTPLANGPYVGGTQDAFERAFALQDTIDRAYFSGTIAGHPVNMHVLRFTEGNDYQGRISNLVVGGPDTTTTWTPAITAAVFTALLPPDARLMRDSSGSWMYDREYNSHLLTEVLDPGNFRGLSAEQITTLVPAGNISVYCPGAHGCEIQLGGQ